MRADKVPRVVKSMRKQPFKGRGQIYRWLRKEYRHLVAAFQETEAGWAVVVEDMIRDGVVGSRGEPPNAKSAARVWARVCRDIAESERQRRTGATGKRGPSHAPAGWRPPVVERPPAAGLSAAKEASPFARAPDRHGGGASDDITPEQLRAGLAEVIAKRSGR